MLCSIGQMPMEGGITVDEILNLKQAAEFLDVSERVLIKLLQQEEIPARKIGKEWRFSSQALLDWLKFGNSKDYAKNAQMENEDD